MRFLFLCVACALFASGCVEFEPAAGLPVKNRAYFIRRTAASSTDLWVCDASSGRPVCYAAAPASGPVVASY